MKLLASLVISFYSISLLAKEVSDSFIVKIYDRSVKIVAPSEYHPEISIIMENKTLSQIRGKIQSDQRVISFVTIEPEKSVSFRSQIMKGENLEFISLTPSFQEVKLIIGGRSYEIPPKK